MRLRNAEVLHLPDRSSSVSWCAHRVCTGAAPRRHHSTPAKPGSIDHGGVSSANPGIRTQLQNLAGASTHPQPAAGCNAPTGGRPGTAGSLSARNNRNARSLADHDPHGARPSFTNAVGDCCIGAEGSRDNIAGQFRSIPFQADFPQAVQACRFHREADDFRISPATPGFEQRDLSRQRRQSRTKDTLMATHLAAWPPCCQFEFQDARRRCT